MASEGAIAGLRYRRSRRSDAAALARMMELGDAVGEGLPTPAVFRIFTERDFAVLIETAMICVTAVRDVPGKDMTEGVGVTADVNTRIATTTTATTITNAATTTAAEQTEEVVAGFISLDDAPPLHDGSSSSNGASKEEEENQSKQDSVRTWMAAHAAKDTKLTDVTLANSLWLRMLLAPSSAFFHSTPITSGAMENAQYTTQEISMDLLRVTLGSLSGVEHIFFSLGGPFACLDSFPGLSNLSNSPSLRHLARVAVLPPLTMRQGRVEDYDDAVALLVAGGPGIITELPAQFYLEELLQSQDAQHKVIVAEDSATHAVVGLACVRQLELEEQQHLSRVYNTDMLERLKPMNVDGTEAAAASVRAQQYQDGRTPSSTASIFFLYFNLGFEHSAYQLLPHIFREFPTCDYATLQRPHAQAQAQAEPMVLERFQYMPLRRYQPYNARGEAAPPPAALWVCPRVSLETEVGMQAQVVPLSDPTSAELRAAVLAQFSALRAASPAGSGVHAVLHQQQQQQQSLGDSTSGTPDRSIGATPNSSLPGCSAELLYALREDLGGDPGQGKQRGAAAGDALPPNRAVFALSWGLPLSVADAASRTATSGRTVVGVVSVQPLSVAEMYALRANYDLDHLLSFNTASGFNYAATDIALTAEEGPLRYRTSDLPGLMVRFAYIRPAFRHHLHFFFREVLRQTRTAVLLNLVSVDASLCQTTLPSFTYVPPRRVVEVEATRDATAVAAARGSGIKTNYASNNFRSHGGGGGGGGSRDSVDAGQRGLAGRIPEVNDVTPALTRSAAGVAAAATNGAEGRGKGGEKEAAAAANLALSSLFCTTRRLLSDERVRVHPRLVVVGASATALSLLYELLKVPYVELLNVTLIATDGVPPHPNQAIADSVASRSLQQQLWQADTMDLLEREYMRLRLGDSFGTSAAASIGANAVRVVLGTLVDIDTNLKFVQLENGVYEPYDHLILTTGRQYIVPQAIQSLQQQQQQQQQGSSGTRSVGGVVALSGVLAEDKLRHALLEMNQSSAASIANVVVYGSGLDAIAALSTMIFVGFPAQRLVLCRPQPDGAAGDAAGGGGVFADAACAEATMALFRVLGVTVLDGYGVSRLEFDDDALSSVLLASLSYERKAGDAVELPCSMIVCMEEKDIDHNVLTALTKRSIVFDGRVIVGTTYETSQPDVLAAGPVAMFTRRYGATESFEAYSARDVGRDVAHALLGRLGLKEFYREGAPTAKKQTSSIHDDDTTSPSAGRDLQDSSMPADEKATLGDSASGAAASAAPSLPSYTSPVARRVRLPCHYQYFSAVRGAAQFRPEECIRLDYNSTDMLAVSLDDVQADIATTAPNDKGSNADDAALREMLVIFIHRRHRTIDGVVYFGNGAPPVHNYRALIGLPESLFHLEFRYKEALEKAKDAMQTDGGMLTAPSRNGKLDLVAYLRLPFLQPLLCDHFSSFFAQLRRDMAAAEEVVAARERVVSAAQASGALSSADAAAQVAELTDTKKAFRYKVQLALLKYLHEGKDRRPQNMYLPSIEKQVVVAASRSTG